MNRYNLKFIFNNQRPWLFRYHAHFPKSLFNPKTLSLFKELVLQTLRHLITDKYVFKNQLLAPEKVPLHRSFLSLHVISYPPKYTQYNLISTTETPCVSKKVFTPDLFLQLLNKEMRHIQDVQTSASPVKKQKEVDQRGLTSSRTHHDLLLEYSQILVLNIKLFYQHF